MGSRAKCPYTGNAYCIWQNATNICEKKMPKQTLERISSKNILISMDNGKPILYLILLWFLWLLWFDCIVSFNRVHIPTYFKPLPSCWRSGIIWEGLVNPVHHLFYSSAHRKRRKENKMTSWCHKTFSSGKRNMRPELQDSCPGPKHGHISASIKLIFKFISISNFTVFFSNDIFLSVSS